MTELNFPRDGSKELALFYNCSLIALEPTIVTKNGPKSSTAHLLWVALVLHFHREVDLQGNLHGFLGPQANLKHQPLLVLH